MKNAWALVFVVVGCACAIDADANQLLRLVPTDAKLVEVRALAGGSQITYDADRKYPSSAVRLEGIAEFQKEGWRYCFDSSEAQQWSTFLRGDGADAERIYQRLSYLRNGDRLITIGQRYVVKGESSSRTQPAINTQKVVIVDAVHKANDIAELTAGTKCE
jgi:hypothetical protein